MLLCLRGEEARSCADEDEDEDEDGEPCAWTLPAVRPRAKEELVGSPRTDLRECDGPAVQGHRL